jgi:hypothetical protein
VRTRVGSCLATRMSDPPGHPNKRRRMLILSRKSKGATPHPRPQDHFASKTMSSLRPTKVGTFTLPRISNWVEQRADQSVAGCGQGSSTCEHDERLRPLPSAETKEHLWIFTPLPRTDQISRNGKIAISRSKQGSCLYGRGSSFAPKPRYSKAYCPGTVSNDHHRWRR